MIDLIRSCAFIARLLPLGRCAALVATTLALAAGVGAPAASASAPTTFCVHHGGYTCPSGSTDEGEDLQAALDAASLQPASAAAPNVVEIGPGSYVSASGGFSYASSNPLRITGAGADATSLTTTAGAGDVLSLGDSDNAQTLSISRVGIAVQTETGIGLALHGGAADHLFVTSQQLKTLGVTLDGATLSSSMIGGGSLETGVEADGQSDELDDDTIDATSTGVVAFDQATLHRVNVKARDDGITAFGAPVSIDDSIVKSGYALYSLDGSINALNDTLIGPEGAQAGVISIANAASGSDVQILNSIIYAFPYSFETSGSGGGAATIEASLDNYDGLVSGTNISHTQSIGSDPGFVDALGGDYHLAFNSTLIDASSIPNLGPGSSSSDLDGNPRVVADGNASTPTDLGAYEYQHRTPQADAAATPPSGNLGTVFAFDSAGSRDPDDGDHLSYRWSFDDGTTGSGATASHAFSTPGQHTATLMVTDTSGLTSTASVTVTVTAAPTGTTTATGGITPLPGGGAGTGTSATGSAGGAGKQATTQPGAPAPGAGAPGRPPRTSAKARIRVIGHSVNGTSIKVTLSCSRIAPCASITLTAVATAHHHRTRVAGRHLSLRRGQTKTLTLTLNRSGRALLAATRKLAITIVARLASAPAARPAAVHATLKA